MKQKCEICGRPAMSNRCVWHKPNKSLQAKSSLRRDPKEKKEEDIKLMWDFFTAIWNKRKHESEISGEKLSSPPSSAYFHHILLKQNCAQGKYDEENIILMTINEHNQVHSDMYRYDEINKRRKNLMLKYGLPD